MQKILTEISCGELIDKISILSCSFLRPTKQAIFVVPISNPTIILPIFSSLFTENSAVSFSFTYYLLVVLEVNF